MTTTFLPADVVVETVAAKGTKFATVVFVKNDGSIRTKNGLFKPLSHIKGTGRGTPEGFIAIYSPNEKKWGSFRTDQVISIK
mgnify:CR=1 FL=1